jgi:predicted GNAT family acetyltransferase
VTNAPEVPIVTVIDNHALERYELEVDGELAGFAEYRLHGAVRTFTHTEVDERFAGRGLASELISGALDDARANGEHVIPICPFVKAFLAKHREYLDLVDARVRRTFNLPDLLNAPT